jgi:hypothetical protein
LEKIKIGGRRVKGKEIQLVSLFVGIVVVSVGIGFIINIPKATAIKATVISVRRETESCRLTTVTTEGSEVTFIGIGIREVNTSWQDAQKIRHWVSNCKLLAEGDQIVILQKQSRLTKKTWWSYQKVTGEITAKRN